jgi:hypothetical protein
MNTIDYRHVSADHAPHGDSVQAVKIVPPHAAHLAVQIWDFDQPEVSFVFNGEIIPFEGRELLPLSEYREMLQSGLLQVMRKVRPNADSCLWPLTIFPNLVYGNTKQYHYRRGGEASLRGVVMSQCDANSGCTTRRIWKHIGQD